MDASELKLAVKTIIVQQEQIIGPLAISEANKVPGLKVTTDFKTLDVAGDSKSILTNLARQYEKLFGKASIEACRESIKEVLPQLPPQDIPEFLR